MVEVSVGSTLVHKVYGLGTVMEIEDTRLKICFESGEEKILGLEWCLKNCQWNTK
ncbi:hypothetical protein P261_02191 [Lachnospiraceae bacterium TWA4]|nr:hypothetical protein P261_02191 [Lachnospiraceae bacterium TWA4]